MRGLQGIPADAGQARMITASPLAAQPGDWRRAYREAITDPLELLRRLDLPELAARLPLNCGDFPLRVPRGFVSRMRRGDAHDPLLRQVLPLDEEYRPVAGYGTDAVGDLPSRAARGLLHKYEGRALLVATGSCAVHCRYCFRRHFPYGEEIAAANGWREALGYLEARPDVDEVILSGGDPLSLSTAKLAEFTRALAARPGIRRLRLHTRLPVVLPERIDAELADWIRGLPWPLVVVIHANHANEIDADVARALETLRAAGARLLNQSVLLRGVNDSAGTLAELSERLFDCQVPPYYLHQLDRVAGAAHFEVPDAEAMRIHAGLRARLPGYLVPLLVREAAGEPNKLPLQDT
jgi:EF-P beta-lysylation protein EpmB